MPHKQTTWHRWAGFGRRLSILALVAGSPLAAQQVGQESVIKPLTTAGQTRGTSIIGEAGEPGRAGGQGSVQPNPVVDAEAAYDSMFREFNSGILRPIKIGTGSGTAQAATPVRLNFGVPIIEWQFRPEDAEIKIGKFFLDFRTLSGSLLYSDNATRSDPATESGVIGMIGWSFSAMFQATEHLRLAVGMNMVYLPFENKIGFIDPMEMFSLNGSPRGLLQVSYDIPIGNWDLHVYDFLSVYTPSYLWGGHFDLFDSDYQGQDDVGRYAYRINDRNVIEDTYDYNRLFDYLTFRNSVGVHASKLIPTETRFSFGAARHDIWSDGLPDDVATSGEMVYAALDNVRENMRFKPHIHYSATHTDGQDGWSHTLKAGVKGPATDYISLFGEVGYYWADKSQREVMLWTLGLDHELTPTTSQRLYYLRSTTWPVESVRTALGYFLRQQLGPDLRAELAAEYSEYDPIDLKAPSHQEYQVGIRAMYAMTGRLNVRSGAYYRLINGGNYEFDGLTVRTELNLRLTPTVDAMLLHQWHNMAVTQGTTPWQENLVILTVRKTF